MNRAFLTIPLMMAGCLTLAGCMGDNRGLASVHQPVVVDGRATVPNCPDWSSQNRDSAATDSNYGCAANANLAAMIANPEDLVHGRDYEGTDAATVTRAIKSWREAIPTGKGGLEKVSSKGGS